eukprot:8801022-Prorocentrum_lima.AAC.1
MTKSGQRRGHQDSITITDPWIARLIHCYFAGKPSRQTLAQHPPRIQRARLVQPLQALGLSH